MTYSNFHGYKALADIENTYSKSTLDEDLPVAYKYFKGTSLLLFSVFLASSLHKKYIKSHNDYLAHNTVHFVFWRSLVQRQFHRICMVTRFFSVRYISLKVRFYSVMLTRTLNKLEVLTQLFSFLCFVVIFRLSLVGVVFEGISMLANALLLWSYCSASSGP